VVFGGCFGASCTKVDLHTMGNASSISALPATAEVSQYLLRIAEGGLRPSYV
jgi:hypothetical protein